VDEGRGTVSVTTDEASASEARPCPVRQLRGSRSFPCAGILVVRIARIFLDRDAVPPSAMGVEVFDDSTDEVAMRRHSQKGIFLCSSAVRLGWMTAFSRRGESHRFKRLTRGRGEILLPGRLGTRVRETAHVRFWNSGGFSWPRVCLPAPTVRVKASSSIARIASRGIDYAAVTRDFPEDHE